MSVENRKLHLEIPEKFNLASDLIDKHIKEGRKNKLAILCGDQRLTYGDVNSQANRIGNAVRSLDVRREERVLLLLPDCPEFIASFLGMAKLGVVPVPTNTMLTPSDYQYMLNDSRARAVIVSDDLLPKIETVRPHLEHLRHIIVVGKPKEGYLSYQHLTEKASAELETVDTSADDVGFWLYSSGTTGRPKGVVHLQHDMVYSAESYGKHIMELDGSSRVYSISRLFFAAGLGAAFNFPFHAGACTVLYPGRPLPETTFEIVDRYRPSVLFGVPTAYNAMLQIEGAENKYDLSSLHICASAGEALPVAIFERWKQKFRMEILDGIGSTEALHIFCSNKRGEVRAGSSGKPFPGYDLKIVDEAGHDVRRGEVGTLFVQGESNFAYYWNKHEKTKETILGTWINTGDKYYQDEDGYFWNVGRTDDMLKVGGIWVSPLEVENCILQHPSVLEVAVVGAVDEEKLVKPKAFIVVKPGFEPTTDLAAEIQTFTKTRIAPYKYPRWIQFVSELPKTATGKIQRFKIRSNESGS